MSFDIASFPGPIPNRLFVEASAGTGKTYLIEHYVVRTILETISEGLVFQPKKLVLITFTRAVAQELRRRLKRTLQSTYDLLVHQGEAPLYLQSFLARDTFERKRLARSIQEVIEHIDEACISTIHGFCDSIVSARMDRFLTEKERLEWLQEYVEELDDTVIHPAEWKKISQYFKYDHSKLLFFLNDLLESPQEYFVQTAYAKLDEAIDHITQEWEGAVHRTSDILLAAVSQYTGTYKYDCVPFFNALEKFIVSKDKEAFFSLLTFPVSLSDLFSTPKKKISIHPEEKKYIDVLINTLSSPLQIVSSAPFLVKKLLIKCQEAFFYFLEKEHAKTPDHVIKIVQMKCRDSDFCKSAASTANWLIVDEFQDTDATQNEIFARLFIQNKEWHGKLLFVGDPKQAIYAFRKADVYSYLQVKDHFLPCETQTLSVNFRASVSVVDAQNALFAASPLFYLPRTKNFLHCPSSTSGGISEDINIADERGAIHFFAAKSRLGRKRRWPHEAIEEKLFTWIADEVIHLSQQGIALHQQAVLVKDRYQARRLGEYFTSKNIPFFSWRVDSVLDSFAYEWLRKAFDLICEPADKKRLISLLFLPESHSQELCRDIESGDQKAWALCASEWTRVLEAFQRKGISGLARSLFRCRWNGTVRVEEWFSEEQLTDLEHLIELISSLEKVLPHDIEAYKDACDKLAEHFTDSQDCLVRRIDPDHEGVRVLTMHKSKGLEFDVVFALGCASRTPIQDDLSSEEADSEKLRQLYVAVTRAKKRCYIPAIFEEDQKKVSLGQASPLELFFAMRSSSSITEWHHDLYSRIHPASEETISSIFTSLNITWSSAEIQRDLVLSEKTPAVFRSPPSLAGSFFHVESFSSLHSAPARFSSGSSALFGIQFHEAIAAMLSDHSLSKETITAWLQKRGIVFPEMPHLLMSAATVELAWQDRTICLRELPQIDIRTECPFFDLHEHTFIRGTIDVLFLWEKKIFALDWKTNVVPSDTTLAAFVQEHNYDKQCEIYKRAAIKAFDGTVQWGGFYFVFVRHLHEGKGIYLCPEGAT